MAQAAYSRMAALALVLLATVNATPLKCRQVNPPIAGFAYKGCFTEATNQRALVGSSYFDDYMTLDKCAAACSAYSYFGVEYGRECYCSSTGLSEGSVLAPETDCIFSCPGHTSQMCGASNRLSVYSKNTTSNATTTSTSAAPSTTAFSTYISDGCYTEATSGRALQEASSTDSLMTPQKCEAICSGYRYFGLEYGTECWCGNSLGAGSVPTGASDCSFACPGDVTQTCGAGNRLNIYVLKNETSASTTLLLTSTFSVNSSSISSSSTDFSSTLLFSTSTEQAITLSSSSSSTDVFSTSPSSSAITLQITSLAVSSSAISVSTAKSTSSSIPSSTSAVQTPITSASSAIAPVSTCSATSPISNTGFEVGNYYAAAPWTAWTSFGTVTFQPVTSSITAARSGTHSFRVHAPAFGTTNYISFQQPVVYCSGLTYNYSAWYKMSVANSGVYIDFGPGQTTGKGVTGTKTQWTQVKGSFVAPAATYYAKQRFYISVTVPRSWQATDIFFDDITVTLA